MKKYFAAAAETVSINMAWKAAYVTARVIIRLQNAIEALIEMGLEFV